MAEYHALSAKWDSERVSLTESVAQLDDSLTFNLAVHYGREAEHILSLLNNVLWRLPVDIRIDLLEDALWHTSLHDEVPFLVPSARAVFRIRNSLAHSVTFEMTGEYLALRTVKRGKAEMTKLTKEQMTWAIHTAASCVVSFLRIEGRIGDTKTWGELYGFSER